MNVLKYLLNEIEYKTVVKTVFGNETYCFLWNSPTTINNIQDFECKNKCILPQDYKDFLLISNGAIIYRSENEDDGYKILSLEEMELITSNMKESGYEIPDKCFCFLRCLFSEDVLLIDLNKESKYILDGDVGYPVKEWKYINSDINTFFVRLCQCNGAMYWRW